MATSASHQDLLTGDNAQSRFDILSQSPPATLKGKGKESQNHLLKLDDIEEGRLSLSAAKKKMAGQLTSKSNGNMLLTMKYTEQIVGESVNEQSSINQKSDMIVDKICLTQEHDEDESDEDDDPTDLAIDRCMKMIRSDLSSPKYMLQQSEISPRNDVQQQ